MKSRAKADKKNTKEGEGRRRRRRPKAGPLTSLIIFSLALPLDFILGFKVWPCGFSPQLPWQSRQRRDRWWGVVEGTAEPSRPSGDIKGFRKGPKVLKLDPSKIFPYMHIFFAFVLRKCMNLKFSHCFTKPSKSLAAKNLPWASNRPDTPTTLKNVAEGLKRAPSNIPFLSLPKAIKSIWGLIMPHKVLWGFIKPYNTLQDL